MKAPRHLIRLSVALAAATLLTVTAQLQAVTDDQALAAACKGCHHKGVVAPLTNLSKLTQPMLFKRLRDYRSGALEGTLMNRIARGYSIEELQRIATELSRRTEPAGTKSP